MFPFNNIAFIDSGNRIDHRIPEPAKGGLNRHIYPALQDFQRLRQDSIDRSFQSRQQPLAMVERSHMEGLSPNPSLIICATMDKVKGFAIKWKYFYMGLDKTNKIDYNTNV